MAGDAGRPRLPLHVGLHRLRVESEPVDAVLEPSTFWISTHADRGYCRRAVDLTRRSPSASSWVRHATGAADDQEEAAAPLPRRPEPREPRQRLGVVHRLGHLVGAARRIAPLCVHELRKEVVWRRRRGARRGGGSRSSPGSRKYSRKDREGRRAAGGAELPQLASRARRRGVERLAERDAGRRIAAMRAVRPSVSDSWIAPAPRCAARRRSLDHEAPQRRLEERAGGARRVGRRELRARSADEEVLRRVLGVLPRAGSHARTAGRWRASASKSWPRSRVGPEDPRPPRRETTPWRAIVGVRRGVEYGRVGGARAAGRGALYRGAGGVSCRCSSRMRCTSSITNGLSWQEWPERTMNSESTGSMWALL